MVGPRICAISSNMAPPRLAFWMCASLIKAGPLSGRLLGPGLSVRWGPFGWLCLAVPPTRPLVLTGWRSAAAERRSCCCMRPVTHGSVAPSSGLIIWRIGMMTLRRTLVAILFPNSPHSSLGCAHSSSCNCEGSNPWALHISARVARRTLLPIHGGHFRECRRHGKCVAAFLAPCRVREICSSTIQSLPCNCMVSYLRATVRTHSTAAAGSKSSTCVHRHGACGCPSPRMSPSSNTSPQLAPVILGASVARSLRMPHI